MSAKVVIEVVVEVMLLVQWRQSGGGAGNKGDAVLSNGEDVGVAGRRAG